ncbi:hypothetical protein DF223_01850 [Mycetocola zhujimingii]|uniref:Uncharacterized protein n=1 Tax=Mycetocola zhujimingii TaxID=2079792 RepID=A0A2U1TH56_9MICO|nr:hypothetical protein DF223_01850 [Mycetocola zhujimingii]
MDLFEEARDSELIGGHVSSDQSFDAMPESSDFGKKRIDLRSEPISEARIAIYVWAVVKFSLDLNDCIQLVHEPGNQAMAAKISQETNVAGEAIKLLLCELSCFDQPRIATLLIIPSDGTE